MVLSIDSLVSAERDVPPSAAYNPSRSIIMNTMLLLASKRALRTVPGLCLIASTLLNTACQTGAGGSPSWMREVTDSLPVMGHRNWIVIADSAYPEQSGQGVETIYTGAHQLDAVKTVLELLDEMKHVTPVVYLDKELRFVRESLAPGVETYRSRLDQLLAGRPVNRLLHEDLIAKLDAAGKTFTVLVLKTDMTIPYTTVFLQLDCAYWGPDKEKQLRQAITESD